MRIVFANTKIEKLCNHRATAHKKLGARCAKVLQQRLVMLYAAEILGDCKRGNPHPLKGNRKAQFSIGLEGAYRLVFKALEPIPKTNDGAIDWQNVEEIKIIFIGDYHE